jgi:hypothetical protein
VTIKAESEDNACEIACEQYGHTKGIGTWHIEVEYIGDGTNLDNGGSLSISSNWQGYSISLVKRRG